jgi:hypothetical protein
MVQLIPNNNNPTRNEITAYIASGNEDELKRVMNEIHKKQALLHPAEEFFVQMMNDTTKIKSRI